MGRHVCGTVSCRREVADDDEFDTRAGQDRQQVREISHVVRAFGRERRTASAKRSAEIIFTIRSPVVSFRVRTKERAIYTILVSLDHGGK